MMKSATPNPITTAVVLNAIADERGRQTLLYEGGSIPWDCADSRVENEPKLAVLVEEVGEVARELLGQLDTKRLYDELIQVAAVAAAWAESLPEAQPE